MDEPNWDDPVEAAEFMDTHGLWGKVSMFRCDHTPEDFVLLRRIGAPGGGHGAVSIQMQVADLPDADMRETPDGDSALEWVSQTILTPSDARRMAVALIEAADEADGNFTNLMGGGGL